MAKQANQAFIHGILNVYKEKGYTSHDVVAKLRGIVKQKKIGHTGTLDPDAQGVLPVCLGKATKLCDLLTDKDKTYETVLLLGTATDTQDISGEVLERKDTGHLTEEAVREAILHFVGGYDQIPPMYSALKVNGQKLYDLARQGIVVERKPRRVEIKQIQILEMDLPRVRLKVSCSKGTYIRTLCHDIGQKLEVCGCMEELLRTKVSIFDVSEARTLSEIQALQEEGRLSEILIPIDRMFEEALPIVVKEDALKLVYNGNTLRTQQAGIPKDTKGGQRFRVYRQDGTFLALYRYGSAGNLLKLEKMFYSQSDDM